MTVCRFMGDFVVRHLGRVRTLQLGGLLSAFGLAPGDAPAVSPARRHRLRRWWAFGLANAVPVLFSTAGQMKDIPPSMGVAMVATLAMAAVLGPPLIGFGGELFGLRAMLGLLIVFAFVIIILSQRAFSAPLFSFPEPFLLES